MNPVARDLARQILSDTATYDGMPVEQLAHVLGRLRRASGLDIRQPVLLRKDENGLFALLPEERGGDSFSICICWCLGDKDACAAYPGRSVAFSERVSGDDAKKILDFLRDKGYTDLWVASNITKAMHTKRMAS